MNCGIYINKICTSKGYGLTIKEYKQFALAMRDAGNGDQLMWNLADKEYAALGHSLAFMSTLNRDKQSFYCHLDPDTNFLLVLIITDTWELAQQYAADTKAILDPDGSHQGRLAKRYHVACVHGGVSRDDQTESFSPPTEDT